MNRRNLVSRGIMSMALAGVNLFAAIVICGFSQQIAYPRLFLLAACVASMLLIHASACFLHAWRRTWDTVNLLATAGFLPTLCLGAVAAEAIAEMLKG
jgi:hypothetical protein